MSLSLPTASFVAGVGLGASFGLYAQTALTPFLPPETQWIPLAGGVALGTVLGGMTAAATWAIKNPSSPSPFKEWDYRKKAEEVFRPSHNTHTVFITGYPEGHDRKGAATLWQNLGDVLQKIPHQDNVVVLSHEQLWFSLEGAQFLARAMSTLWSEKPYVTMLLGASLFSTNGAHRQLKKGREDRKAQEIYPIAFRVCAELRQSDLSEGSATYFVSASMISSNSSEPIIKPPIHQTIYINDEPLGLRRITPNHDSGWLSPSEITIWDDATHRHHVVSLGM